MPLCTFVADEQGCFDFNGSERVFIFCSPPHHTCMTNQSNCCRSECFFCSVCHAPTELTKQKSYEKANGSRKTSSTPGIMRTYFEVFPNGRQEHNDRNASLQQHTVRQNEKIGVEQFCGEGGRGGALPHATPAAVVVNGDISCADSRSASILKRA